jgi:hypothetical protein
MCMNRPDVSFPLKLLALTTKSEARHTTNPVTRQGPQTRDGLRKLQTLFSGSSLKIVKLTSLPVYQEAVYFLS